MSYSRRRATTSEPMWRGLLLRIAADLQGVTARIGEIKGLSEWQLSDLGDAAAGAARARSALAANGMTVDREFRALVDEMSELHGRLDSHVRSGRQLAGEFLAVARALAQEVAFIQGESGVEAVNAMVRAHSVVSLETLRAARSGGETVQRRAKDLHVSLRSLQDSVAALFLAQAQSGRDMASLRRRMLQYAERAAVGPA